jgi:apolipoprotein N-acyltransferase
LLEYLRSHLLTGFPWALLAYSQYKNLPIIQIVDTTGAWGVSFLIMVINIAIYSAFSSRLSAPGFKRKYLLPILCLLIVLSYGYYKIYRTPDTKHQTAIKVSVIQGNIPQELKWDPSARSYILNRYEQLSKDAASEHPNLIVWPEASSPGLLGEDNSVFREIFSLARDIRTPLLIGTVARDGKEYFNSCLLINSAGEISGRYDKLHLVPFGEYIPFKKYLPFLETIVPIGDINEGREYTIFQIPNPKSQISNKFAVLICFEDLFPELSRKFIQEGAQFLVNITNDAWYKQTSASYQHLQASVFRAIENRVFLARAANTGISGFIDPSGRIISLVTDAGGKEIFSTGYKTKEIAMLKHGQTFYNRFGDYFVLVCFLFIPRGLKPRPSGRG